MALPEGPVQSTTLTEQWVLEEIYWLRDRARSAELLRVIVRDRLIKNGQLTDTYRTREVPGAVADALGLDARFLATVTIIHTSAVAQ